jgi:hypothetical protein
VQVVGGQAELEQAELFGSLIGQWPCIYCGADRDTARQLGMPLPATPPRDSIWVMRLPDMATGQPNAGPVVRLGLAQVFWEQQDAPSDHLTPPEYTGGTGGPA